MPAPGRAGARCWSGLAGAALAAFFASCVAFSLRPGMLAALSAEVRVQAPEQPCERLAAERDRLIAAQQADHPGLIEATKQRMRPAAQDCLGLPSEAMAAEAVERLASKTALARNDTTPAQRRPVGMATAEAGATDATVATPPEVAELKPSETQMKGGLAGLLAGLRDNEEATASDRTAPPAAPLKPGAAPLGPPARPAGPAADRASPAVVPVTPAAIRARARRSGRRPRERCSRAGRPPSRDARARRPAGRARGRAGTDCGPGRTTGSRPVASAARAQADPVRHDRGAQLSRGSERRRAPARHPRPGGPAAGAGRGCGLGGSAPR